VQKEKVIVQTLESELEEIQQELGRLSAKQRAIQKVLRTYSSDHTSSTPHATPEINTVDMARTVIRNAGRPMKSKRGR
jgi:cob(I)alamin adenosyltransferase